MFGGRSEGSCRESRGLGWWSPGSFPPEVMVKVNQPAHAPKSTLLSPRFLFESILDPALPLKGRKSLCRSSVCCSGVSECLFCHSDMACLKDADTVAVSMKFPSGAIVTLDISQHCTKSCDQRLEVRSCF